jgi:Zn-dependent M28 family amino/carboxypeptidase
VARRLFALAGSDLDELRRQAQTRDFHPVELNLRAIGRLVSAVRSFPQFNVAGVVEGTDPELKSELVIYSAHWDHLGIQDGRIYNGAVDNAAACATLLAIAEASADRPARRSQMFLFTCGEEQGLLGASAYVQRPLWPLAKTVANLNLESLNWVGLSRDIEFLGGQRSDLLELGEQTARDLGMVLRPPEPDIQGLYFRSDHFPFAKASIPAVSPGFSMAGQRDYLEDRDRSCAKARGFQDRYHQESDDFDPSWDLRGMVQQGEFILNLGRLIANSPVRPQWKPAPATGSPRQESSAPSLLSGIGAEVSAVSLSEIAGRRGAWMLPGVVVHANPCGPERFESNLQLANPTTGPVRVHLRRGGGGAILIGSASRGRAHWSGSSAPPRVGRGGTCRGRRPRSPGAAGLRSARRSPRARPAPTPGRGRR